jgi:IS605 OrfB family transposase
MLRRRGTTAAKRRLKKLSGKEARFLRKHTNHVISKEIVATAGRSRSAIALEDLTHIRKRTKVRKAQRSRLARWSFTQQASSIDDIIANVWNPTRCDCVESCYYSLSLKP